MVTAVLKLTDLAARVERVEQSAARRIEELAGADGISVRTGCFCNPGAGEIAE